MVAVNLADSLCAFAKGMMAPPVVMQQPMVGVVPAVVVPTQPMVVPAQPALARAPQLMSITVPMGLQPGQQFNFTDSQGRVLAMAVPPGVYGGQSIQVQA